METNSSSEKKPRGSKWYVTYDYRRGVLVEKTGHFINGHTDWCEVVEGPFESKEAARDRKEAMNEEVKAGTRVLPTKWTPKPKNPKYTKKTVKISDVFTKEERKMLTSTVSRTPKEDRPIKKKYEDRTSIQRRSTPMTESEKMLSGMRQVRPTRLTYYLVECKRKPGEVMINYDFIQAGDLREASRISQEKGLILVKEMTTSFRESIGIAVFDLKIPTEALIPLRPKNL